MKKFFINVLIFIIILIGWTSTALYFKLPGFNWYHYILGIVVQIILLPALFWWKDYFYELFDI